MRIVLLNASPARHGRDAVRHEIAIDVGVHGTAPSRGTDLVIIDASKMSAGEVHEALEWIGDTRKREPSARIAIAWPNPPIDFVVKALRAGVNDFIKEPLSLAQVHRILVRCGTPTAAPRAARALLACGTLLQQTTFTEEEADLANVLMRERKVHMREVALAAETTRLENMREVLQHRENELRLRAMRLDEEFMQLQNDADLRLVPSGLLSDHGGRVPTRVDGSHTDRVDIESRERLLSDSGDGS